MKTLTELMAHIAKVWTCDEARYPELAKLDAVGQKNFRLKHSVLHFNKSVGKLAALAETYDHEGTLSDAEAQLIATKLFVNSLKLAEEVGLSADDLLSRAPEIVH